MARADVERFIAQARDAGVIGPDTAQALYALAAKPGSLDGSEDTEPAAPADATPALHAAAARAARAAARDRERDAHARRLDELREARRAAIESRAERAAQRSAERAGQVGALEALLGGTAAADGGDALLEIVAEVDGTPSARMREEVLPLVYENVGWLIGALLVLSGSIYGLREAWTTFGEAGRWASAGGALFVYHAVFILFGVLLARRSQVAGQFLSAIGACLVPLAFVAVANLLAASRPMGIAAAILFTAGGVVSLGVAARRFGAADAPSGRGLLAVAVLVPSVALLAHPLLESSASLRFLLALVALLGPLAVAAARAPSLGVFLLGLYAALAAEVFALSSNATDDGAATALLWRTGGLTFGAWLCGYLTALGLVLAAGRRLRPASELMRRAVVVLDWLGYALALTASGIAMITTLGRGPDVPTTTPLAVALAAGVGAASLAVSRSTRRGGLLILMIAASLVAAVACRLVLREPELSHAWAAAALVPPLGYLAVFRSARTEGARGHLAVAAAGWAAVLLTLLWMLEPTGEAKLTVLGAALLALGYHAQAGRAGSGRPWHAAAAIVAACGALALAQVVPDARASGAAIAILGALYFGAALATHVDALDDASLGLFLLAVPLAAMALVFAPQFAARGGLAIAPASLASVWPLVGVGVGLLARGPRDTSALPPLVGAACLALAAFTVASPDSMGTTILTLSALGLVAVLSAAILTPATRAPALGRALGGGVELPWAWAGRGAIAQGFGLTAIALLLLSALANVVWLGQQADRDPAIGGGVVAIVAIGSGFVSRAWVTVELRGRALVLWALAVAVALTAVTNRIGRPLPPAVVGLNLSVIGAGLWLLARGVHRAGPWVADRLAAPVAEGHRYHFVPHAGVLALALLLVVDAVLLTPAPLYRALTVIPPLMLVGPALLVLLLGRSARWRGSPIVIVPLLTIGAALAGAQLRLLGPALVPLTPPGSAWVPAMSAAADPARWLDAAVYGDPATFPALYGRALAGVGGLAAALAALALGARSVAPAAGHLTWALWARRDDASRRALIDLAAISSGVLVGVVTLAGVFVTSPAAATGALVAGVGVAAIARRAIGRLPVVLAATLAIHTAAQLAPTVGPWAGPAMGAVALVLAIAARATLSKSARPAAHIIGADAVCVWVGVAALAYGFAVSGTNAELVEGPIVLSNAIDGIARWGTSAVPGLALGLVGASALVSALSWNALARRAPTVRSTVSAGLVFAAGLATAWVALARPLAPTSIIALSLALVATAAHAGRVAARLVDPPDEELLDLRAALGVARDVLIPLCGGVLVLAAQAALLDPTLGFVAIGLCFAVSVHAVIADGTARHVYFAQLALTGAYGFLRASVWTDVRPEHDALVFLAMGFVLIGVTVVARRRGVDTVADATRRFAAALPLLLPLVLPWEATGETAGFALASSVLYAALGWAERSRVMGTFGAVAANVALLSWALSQGLDGFDAYLVPFGVLVVIVVHLFADRMEPPVRVSLRFVGTALTFAPSALAIVLQIGNAQHDLYPLGFAGACLFAIVAGMWFHVRAYLVLGLAFLVLDIGALLVRASLRDQRLGFFVLSATGLAILAGMAAYTMRKEQVRTALARLRRALATWD